MPSNRPRLDNDNDSDSDVEVIRTVKANPAKKNDENVRLRKRQALEDMIKKEAREEEEQRKRQKKIEHPKDRENKEENGQTEKLRSTTTKRDGPSLSTSQKDKKKDERRDRRIDVVKSRDAVEPNRAATAADVTPASKGQPLQPVPTAPAVPKTAVVRPENAEEVGLEAPLGEEEQPASAAHAAFSPEVLIMQLQLQQMEQAQKKDREVQKSIQVQLKALTDAVLNSTASAPAAAATAATRQAAAPAAATTLRSALHQNMGAACAAAPRLGLDDPASGADKMYWNLKSLSNECPRGCGPMKGVDRVAKRAKHYKEHHYPVYFDLVQKSMKHLEQWLCMNFGEDKKGMRVCVHCDGDHRWPDHGNRVQLAHHIQSKHAGVFKDLAEEYKDIAKGQRNKPDIALHSILTASATQ